MPYRSAASTETAAASIDWVRQYRHFATHECSQDPLYVAICLAVADSPELLALMQQVPATQARPNLLLAALHERVLAGVAHALADYYPSVGGTRPPDAALPAQLLDFARQQHPALLAHLRGRATQTNEIGRCAVLWPALQRLAALSGRRELALFDFGSSAGLNLGVDRYHYDYGPFQRGARPDPERPRIACRWLGEAPPPPVEFELVARLGVDLAPVDLLDEDGVRWLRACLWPQDRARAQRLDQALALARAAGPAVERHADGLDRLERWLDELPAGVQPVLFNSWVLAYFEPAALARYQARVAELVRARGLAWISAEAAELRPAGLAQPPAVQAVQGGPQQTATLWSLQWREAQALRQRALAWSHAHGQWLQWLDA
ncbi:DUF2332 domain-containing protein [Paucibacter sediminis]|uniref:DUF2332 domain-containing protein n=1 Tax=Paucibacter sediminis TaxID=3019553 RepID=A0AA95SQM4_9BURK|nr:DUF2332 domain-containing protein [Paucibacter sp. S2-9]WIT13610.1 DUF2332 domain-containing protein [Paucibacter sp. S2-9]